jgi:cob(I)alamin adenosyltransferase
MVLLNRIYTRAGDAGTTRLVTGEAVSKADLRVEAYGAVDELNAALGVARLETGRDAILDPILARIQNDLFDLGADLATPDARPAAAGALRVVDSQVERLEQEIDLLNADLAPLTSFVLPGGSKAAVMLHVARTVCRRAERRAVSFVLALQSEASRAEPSLAEAGAGTPHDPALRYLNRLSDLLFVASRFVNGLGEGDVLWVPAATR